MLSSTSFYITLDFYDYESFLESYFFLNVKANFDYIGG
jgi:hypothetical protein